MQRLKWIIKSFSFSLIFLILFQVATGIFQDKTCANEYKVFWEEEIDNYDMLLFGTSVARGGYRR